MSQQETNNIHGVINNNSGQASIGKNNSQVQNFGAAQPKVTEANLAELRQLLANLKAQVEREAPPEKKAAALERVEELKEAVTVDKLDSETLNTMGYVRGWFTKHLPGLAGAVSSIVIHPFVGKLVEAAGEAMADDFRRRFAGK